MWLDVAASYCSIDITNTCEWSELPTRFFFQIWNYNMEQLKPSKELDFEANNLPKEWKQWREVFSLFISLAMSGKTDQVKVQMLQYLIGPRGREVYRTVKPDVENLQNALDALGKHCNPPPPPQEWDCESMPILHQKKRAGRNFDSFLTELKLLVKQWCNFGDLRDSLISDRIICGIQENAMRERLLRETTHTLDKQSNHLWYSGKRHERKAPERNNTYFG